MLVHSVLIKLMLICYQLFGASCLICLGKSSTRRWLWRYSSLSFLFFVVLHIDEPAKTCVIRTKCFKLKSQLRSPYMKSQRRAMAHLMMGGFFFHLIGSKICSFQLTLNVRFVEEEFPKETFHESECCRYGAPAAGYGAPSYAAETG